jgi:autotransporter translocation and assembly factor TamB
VKSSNEDLAKTLAGNLVAAQLQNSIGNALGMDVIEIKGENSWKQASLTAGKYLTDDLYVSYEKGFGNSEMGEVNPSIVTLEYGILEFLFFQLVEGNDKTAGFDFIFKFHF